VACY